MLYTLIFTAICLTALISGSYYYEKNLQKQHILNILFKYANQ